MSQMTIDGHTVELRPARMEEVIDLRHVVLREGLPRSEAIFPGDELPTSRHYAAFHDGRTVCCVTLHASQWEGEPAWQLRGMATSDDFRGRGIGKALMRMLEADVRANSPVHLLWCNARVPAARFYQEQGWAIRSDVFEIPTAGPHYRMTKRLG
jgi:GNAT superfamily N-acetyltransferase